MMINLEKFVHNIDIPKMVEVQQDFGAVSLKDVEKELLQELNSPRIASSIKKDMKIAVAVGSRGICNIFLIVKTIVSFLQAKGADVYIVPAMGSHGGATEKGQRDLLASYGIDEKRIGAPIRANMDVEIFKTVGDRPIYIGKEALEADHVVLINRVKPHTSFRGKYESGLLKMCAVGLGKQKSAEVCHRDGFGKMASNVEELGSEIIKSELILFGVAILENEEEKTRRIRALLPTEIIQEEPVLLEDARNHIPRILIPECDALIVDYIGKNISGPGADPNVTGLFAVAGVSGGLKSNASTYLDLTDESHGNANGVGVADVITRRLYEKIDFGMTYPNALTSTLATNVKIPLIMDNQRDAIKTAIKFGWETDPKKVRLIRIKNTLEVEKIYISEGLLNTAEKIQGIIQIGKLENMTFDNKGNLF